MSELALTEGDLSCAGGEQVGLLVSITAISVGWNPIRLEDTTQNNFKIGVGRRFRF